MNKKINLTIAILFISALSIAAFSACDKDTNCYLDVKVFNGSTSRTISKAKVQIHQRGNDAEPDTSDYNYTEGYTDEDGVFSTSYTAPAILNVKATLFLDTISISGESLVRGARTGRATVRIAEGETKVCNVRVAQDTTWVPTTVEEIESSFQQ